MAQNSEKLFRAVMEHNLNEVTRFHRHLRGSLAQMYQAAGKNPGAIADIENYDDYLASNTFLMVYSYLEEYLYLIWKRKAGEKERKRGFSIARYEPVLESLGVASSHSAWKFLLKATDVRHCLLHANDRLSLMKNSSPKQLKGLIEEFSPEISLKVGDRLSVNVYFLQRFVDQVRVFREEIEVPKPR